MVLERFIAAAKMGSFCKVFKAVFKAWARTADEHPTLPSQPLFVSEIKVACVSVKKLRCIKS